MFGQDGPSLQAQEKGREVSRLNMRHFIEHQVKLSMGTDSTSFMNFQQDDPNALEMGYMVELGLSPMDANHRGNPQWRADVGNGGAAGYH